MNKELIASHLFMEGLDGCVVAWHCLSAGVYWTTCVIQCQTITFFCCTKFIGQCKWVTLLQYSLDRTDNTFYGNYGNHVHSISCSLFLFFFRSSSEPKIQFSFCSLSVCLSVRMFVWYFYNYLMPCIYVTLSIYIRGALTCVYFPQTFLVFQKSIPLQLQIAAEL